jgi:hypothetical protein
LPPLSIALEALPGTGDLATTADLVVSLLGLYLDPNT